MTPQDLATLTLIALWGPLYGGTLTYLGCRPTCAWWKHVAMWLGGFAAIAFCWVIFTILHACLVQLFTQGLA
jgi:hypothetical protein